MTFLVNEVWEKRQMAHWLRLLRSGDHQAFEWFIDKYKETVFLCCRRLGLQEAEIEDVASDTFLAAYQGLSRYTGQSDLSTWLWSIAYRKAVNYLRKKRRRWQLEDRLNEQIVDTGSSGPAAAIQAQETEKIVWRAVERLPRLWALAIILYYREQKSIADIAKIMNTRENTVKTYLFRARARLKELLAVAFGANDSDRQI
jgi:RNA polymerase sigma factor (sigma-70 family)